MVHVCPVQLKSEAKIWSNLTFNYMVDIRLVYTEIKKLNEVSLILETTDRHWSCLHIKEKVGFIPV